ncbi:YgiQ family radical SAM protein [Candidatus Wirthbacteria bacterium CG2_30_54_11]|uniref:YgiQ family radical SAM protein n=1 Tax=Candidatus Wirthbacteria bacterium CG2_30_54_11 TaxID=1817892 RepID=A0A1J5IJ19_9BACT|nr:MAG: YgiQ family radical SAM protein [Candidatus Wirthbacteria bacterium CG2_30_54_11]
MISTLGTNFDIILISGEYWDDHPYSPVGVIARVLESRGFSVGIIEKPVKAEDFTRLGRPRLFFGITSGSIDSMLHNYTPLKKEREDSAAEGEPRLRRRGTRNVEPMPDRAVIVYCQKLKEQFKGVPLVIGGVEASLRRFAHYDYWDNAVRRSILLDSRADILVYGNGEKQVVEIAERLDKGEGLSGVAGTCVIQKEVPEGIELVPPYETASIDPRAFCALQRALSNQKTIAQPHGNRFVVQYCYPVYTPADLDWIYGLPYTRDLHPGSLLAMAQFSVITHRGCVGDCHFCSLGLHQGNTIISRSEDSILGEIERLTHYEKFKGYIDDLGGPAANMYGMDCEMVHCSPHCASCTRADLSHDRLIRLMRKARAIPGVKKVFVRSGVRFDLAIKSKPYIRELSEYHISGCLKIAPEHVSPAVLKQMNKQNDGLNEFVAIFQDLNRKKKQFLTYYFMVGHPGETTQTALELSREMKSLRNVEQFQLFTPLPMTVSACMYWTHLDPYTLERVEVVADYKGKKELKRLLLGESGEERSVGKYAPRTKPGRPMLQQQRRVFPGTKKHLK